MNDFRFSRQFLVSCIHDSCPLFFIIFFLFRPGQDLQGTKAAEQIVCRIAALLQNPFGNIAAKADRAKDQIPFIPVQFVQPLPKLTERDGGSPFDRTCHGFRFLPDVKKNVIVGILKVLGCGDGVGQAFQDIFSNKAREVDRVLGCAIRRGIGKFQFSQIPDRSPEVDGGRDDIDPFVHPLIADDLGPQHATVFGEKEFECHGQGPWIITDMVHGMDQRVKIILAIDQACPLQLFFIHSCRSGSQIKDFGHTGSDGPPVDFDRLIGEDVGADKTALAVGGTRQRNGRAATQERLIHLDYIAYGIDIRVGSPKPPVDRNVTARSQLQARLPGQFTVGPYAHAKKIHIREDDRPVA